MPNVFDAADYILRKKGPMTTLKLEKLCYYAQVWSLVWEEEPLFDEDFQAWANGPVCPELYQWHKGRFRVDAEDIPAEYRTQDLLTEQQRDTIDAVLRDYGDHTGQWLSDLTHLEDPWRNARGMLGPGKRCSKVMRKGDLAYYYGSL